MTRNDLIRPSETQNGFEWLSDLYKWLIVTQSASKCLKFNLSDSNKLKGLKDTQMTWKDKEGLKIYQKDAKGLKLLKITQNDSKLLKVTQID